MLPGVKSTLLLVCIGTCRACVDTDESCPTDVNTIVIQCDGSASSAISNATKAGCPLTCGNCPAPPPSAPGGYGYSFASKGDLRDALEAWHEETCGLGQDEPCAATYGAVSTWDVRDVTSFSSLLLGLPNFAEELSGWDTSKVTDMEAMLWGQGPTNANRHVAFNLPLPFDTASVTSMKKMFGYTAVFNQPLSFDTSIVTNMMNMLLGAEAFNASLAFDTGSVNNMAGMIQSSDVFNTRLDFDTGSVTKITDMFSLTDAFNQPLIFDTASVTDTGWGSMFRLAVAFNEVVAFDTSVCTSFYIWFSGATAFNQPLAFDTRGR